MQRQYPGRNNSNNQTPIIRNQGEQLIQQTQPQIMSAGTQQQHYYPYPQSGTLQPLLQPPTHHQMLIADQHFIDTSFESALTGRDTVSPQLPPVFEYDGLKYIDTARVEPKMGYSPEKTPISPETPHFQKKPFAEPLDGIVINQDPALGINLENAIPMHIQQFQQQSLPQEFEMADMSAPIATSPTLMEEERRKRSSMEIEQMESSPGNTLRDRNRRQQYNLSPPVSPVPVVELLHESPGSRNRRRATDTQPDEPKPVRYTPFRN